MILTQADALGNSTSETLTLTVDQSPPSLTVTSPAVGSRDGLESRPESCRDV